MNDVVGRLEEQRKNMITMKRRADGLLKLRDNKLFKELITEFFMTEECARMVRLSTDTSAPKEDREDALAIAQSAGHLARWMSSIIQMGTTMGDHMDEIDQMIVEARQEADLESSEEETENANELN